MMQPRNFLPVVAAVIWLAASCKKDNTPVTPYSTGTKIDTIYLRGTITADSTLRKDDVYYLRGYVYVDNSTLTIEPGTIIYSKKDSAGMLVIYKDAKINAVRSADQPIVFTSAEARPAPGDLGGLILVGKAGVNGNHTKLLAAVDSLHSSFGGTADGDNSGILKYVRLEYGGSAATPGNGVAGLSLYGAGSSTTIDYIQASRSMSDAFAFFGGTVNAKHLIAYSCADDDLDMDDGYRGKIQYAIAFKDPLFTDKKGTTGDLSNNIEVDNTDGTLPFGTMPRTAPILANITAIGPNNASGTSIDHGYSLMLRRGGGFHLANAVVIGGQKGLISLNNTPTIDLFSTGANGITRCLLYTVASPPVVVDYIAPRAYGAAALMAALAAAGNKMLGAASNALLSDPLNVIRPNAKPLANSPALTIGTAWSGPYSDAFFDQVPFAGAMDASSDWTSGWAAWGK